MRTTRTKEKYRREDERLRKEIGALLEAEGNFPHETTAKLVAWNPYDQNSSADFFDAEWMFGVRDGFDVVIGNPPYVRQEQIKEFKPAFQSQYKCFTGTADLYVYCGALAFTNFAARLISSVTFPMVCTTISTCSLASFQFRCSIASLTPGSVLTP